MDEDTFKAVYTRRPEIASQAENGDTWLIDKPGPELECIFLENNRCRIHAVKPSQCIGFPMKWRTPDILDYCEGMRQ
jgi:Fe-S-cluster containining protein